MRIRYYSTVSISAEQTQDSPVATDLQNAVVSRALAIECECLLLVGMSAGTSTADKPIAAETLPPLAPMRRRLQRLLAAWELLSPSVEPAHAKQATSRVRQMLALLPVQPSFGQVAQDLLDQAQDTKVRAALRQVMDQWRALALPAASGHNATCRGRLSRLLQEDSSAWRQTFADRQVPAEQIIHAGFGRSYERAAALAQKYRGRELGAGKLHRWCRRVTLVACQLELFDAELSEENRECLWYLQRLERNLLQRVEVKRFVQALQTGLEGQSKQLGKACGRCEKAAQQHHKQLVKRAKNLSRAGLQRRTANFCQAIANDSGKIAPSSISP